MPKTPSTKLSISYEDELAFTLHSIALEPRRCTPLDVAAAIRNLRVEFHGENEDEIAALSKKIVNYLLTDFFVQAHRTGLYNRQLKLWSALATVADVKFSRLQQGFFKKTNLPVWDLLMLDGKGRTILLLRIVGEEPNLEFDLQNEKGCKALLANTVLRAERLKLESPAFSGVFLFCPRQAGQLVHSCLSSVTAIDDPVGKYEARIATLPDISMDLFGYDPVGDDLQMLHPTLQKMRSGDKVSSTQN